MLKQHIKARLHLNTRGDTIVEVLIAIAIVSLILGGAFVATNRSLMATRDAEERSDALKLVEGQIEQLKNLATSDADQLFVTAPASYCIASGSPVSSSTTPCQVNAAGVHDTTSQPVYSLVITRSANTFTIVNSWFTNSGKATSLQMKYRVYD